MGATKRWAELVVYYCGLLAEQSEEEGVLFRPFWQCAGVERFCRPLFP